MKMQKNKGIAPIVIIAIIVVVAALGYGGYKVATKSEVEVNTGVDTSNSQNETSTGNSEVKADADVNANTNVNVSAGTSANLSFNTLGDATKAGKNLKCTIALSSSLILYISSDGKIRQESMANGTLIGVAVYADGKVYAKNLMAGDSIQTMTGTQAQTMTSLILGTSLQMFTCVETPANPSLFVLK